jgi:hypothetical protein
LQTNAALENLQANVVSRNAVIESNQIATFDKLSSQASTLEKQFQDFLEAKWVAMEHNMVSASQMLRNFTNSLTASNSELERHMAVNTENLERQADAIAKVKASSDDYTYLLLGFLLCFTLLAPSPSLTKFLIIVALLAFTAIKMSGLLSILGQTTRYTLNSSVTSNLMLQILISVTAVFLFVLCVSFFVDRMKERRVRAHANLMLISEKNDGVSAA